MGESARGANQGLSARDRVRERLRPPSQKVISRLSIGSRGDTVSGHLPVTILREPDSVMSVRRILTALVAIGVVGGAMLALGRALGETMAVTFVVGNAHHINASILAPGTTISATIANEFAEALGDLYIPALIEAGLILFLITFIVLASAQLMLRSIERRSGGGSR